MLATLRSTLLGLKASYWFYPALFALAGLVGALCLIHVDRLGAAQWLSESGWINPARPKGASHMLTVLSGSMIGVASTVFSITIAAVAYASGTYGPRLLNNFMEDRGNKFSLGTFIATFVYSITVLRAVRTEDEARTPLLPGGEESAAFVPQLSLLVAFALMIVAVGVLVYFLHHIPASIRINTVLEAIGGRLLRQIDDRFPNSGSRDPAAPARPHGALVRAHGTGYVRLVEFGQLREIATREYLLATLLVRAGDFVYPGVPIIATDAPELRESVDEAMRETFAFGASRTPEQDIEFALDELVEIALRALSPGVNDPFTAITAIHWMGAALAEFGRRDLAAQDWNGDDAACPVLPCHSDFAHFLDRSFGAARPSLASNNLTALMTLEALARAAALVKGDHRRELLYSEMDRLVDQAKVLLSAPEIPKIEQRLQALLLQAGRG